MRVLIIITALGISVGFCRGVVWYTPTKERSFEQVIKERLTGATQRIWVALYRLTSSACVDALVQAKKRGIDVRVLFDRGQIELPAHARLFKELRQAAIPVWWLGPDPLMHNKLAIVDNAVLTGSVNWTWSGFGVNAESCVLFDEPEIVQEYVTHFNTLMRRAAGFVEKTVWRCPVVFFVPDHVRELKGALEKALKSASREITVAMYTCTLSWLWNHLVAAAKRGVRVRVILEPSLISNSASLRNAQKNGVSVLVYGESKGIMHHKLMIIDDAVWVGSMNLTPAGTKRHQENICIIQDQSVVAQIKPEIEALFKNGRRYTARVQQAHV